MRLITRSEWGARPPKDITRMSGSPAGVTLHWEGPQMGVFPHEECAGKVRIIQTFHMETKRWDDIAYNAVVCPHGYVFQGRWTGVRSAANGTNQGNKTHYAICGLFGENDGFSDEAKAAFKETIDLFRASGAGSQIKPHGVWKNTACPGPSVMKWIVDGCPVTEVRRDPSDPTDTQTAVAIEVFNDGCWTFDEFGQVFAEGEAPLYGSLAGVALNAPIVKGLAHNGKTGYWMVGADGGIFAFGSAPVIRPYEPLMAEYQQGQRRIVDAVRQGNGLVLMSNLGERYQLGV